MKFEDKANPYFEGGKKTMQEWVNENIEEMEKEMKKEDFESEGIPYGLRVVKVYEIVIAFGGPSMVIEIDTMDGEIQGGRYRYAWYSTPEVVEIDEEQAEKVAQYYDLYIE